jgi:CheY-like chemotaxis protein
MRKRSRPTGVIGAATVRRQGAVAVREAGFNHHLTKPVDIDELAALLAEYSAISGSPR